MQFKCVRISCESCPHKILCDESPYYGVEIPDDYILVSWANKYDEGADIINKPIIIESKCIGVITGVSKEYVYGKIFAQALLERIENGKCVGFEIIGRNK